jgi:hypothetical protein
MKKLFYIAALAMIVACGKDEVNPSIIGEWELEYFYRDDNGNPINIDNATKYTKVAAPYPPHTLVFTNLNECGLIETFNTTDYQSYTYSINNDNIVISERCESHFETSSPNHLLGYPIKYRIKDNTLILGHLLTIYIGDSYDITIYGFYKYKQ